MTWPPLKAWTSKNIIEGQRHFVAINYGGEKLQRWVILMSVIDSAVVIKVVFSQLVDSSNWKHGWQEKIYLDSSTSSNNKIEIRRNKCSKPSFDSGLTIPITKNFIRPWFAKT
tara:strand:- start:719 stop:1057 length:339 start_codon:yes stop_codon:yes gene_type:complete